MDDFTGEHVMSGDAFRGIDVAKGNNDPTNMRKDDFKVDALAGATITGNGVAAMIKKDVGMYIPYLKKMIKNQDETPEAEQVIKTSDSVQ